VTAPAVTDSLGRPQGHKTSTRSNIECVTRAAAAWGIAQSIDAAEAGYLFSCGMNVFPEGPTPVI
jgi:hypothetical protein